MNTTLSNMLGAAGLLPSSFLTVTYRECGVGIAAVPAGTLYTLPFGGFVLPDVGVNSPANCLPRELGPFAKKSMCGVMSSSGVRGMSMSTAGKLTIFSPINDYSNARRDSNGVIVRESTLLALELAQTQGIRDLIFTVPLGRDQSFGGAIYREDDVVEVMLYSIFQYLDGQASKPCFDNILVRVGSPAVIMSEKPLIGELRSQSIGGCQTIVADEVDGCLAEVKEFMDIKGRCEDSLPKLVSWAFDYRRTSLFLQLSSEQSGIPEKDFVDALRPADGRLRLFSNALIDRAFSMLPEYVRESDLSRSPRSYCFSRSIDEKKIKACGESSLEISKYIRSCAVSVRSDQTGDRFVIGELNFVDILRSNLDHSSKIAQYLIVPYLPLLLASYIREFSGGKIVSNKVFKRFQENCPNSVESVRFDMEDIDRILVFFILRECANIYWKALPKELQDRWCNMYAGDRKHKGDFIYYRNYLRFLSGLNSNGESDARAVAEGIFADKVALRWCTDVPKMFERMGIVITDEEMAMIKETMEIAKRRREEHGSAFYFE